MVPVEPPHRHGAHLPVMNLARVVPRIVQHGRRRVGDEDARRTRTRRHEPAQSDARAKLEHRRARRPRHLEQIVAQVERAAPHLQPHAIERRANRVAQPQHAAVGMRRDAAAPLRAEVAVVVLVLRLRRWPVLEDSDGVGLRRRRRAAQVHVGEVHVG